MAKFFRISTLKLGYMIKFAARRAIHTVPRLPGISKLETEGIPNIFSAGGFKQCWLDQQKYLCDKLTLATAGTALESYLPFHIVLNTAKKPFQTHIFNLASAAHNNHLFIENILPTDGVETKPSRLFEQRIRAQFDHSWEEVKEEMVRRSEQEVLGQGWLFLVENANKEVHILTVQNNGTPYYFPRNQSIDFNAPVSTEDLDQFKEIEALASKGDVEDWTMPLIAVNLWDQAYLKDYGVAGRSKYVKNVLDNLNWIAINKRLYSGN
ncbi:mitochondrial 37S ribosomal protein mS42 Ecym_7164 [Eremothecium cymbalariae DBVPG|uniref:Manganese/iron superoxide dismutase C-terminal domain-containing protein n=1 Tax=Eremothecium cymbalariae (strain CBS 270.75 / DBVPG 7215 / KCTC 17166 / NRRL Y-17582) TaxID=931890 RepID=G8JVZ7_ERECY|nr:hypothetical protein Ecym_7164 [Eremothecium cymbalariae DBVPG\